ncbi:MAG TPA: citrate/2-methylcitrate synthase [Chthoniobacterales bacterium]|jgi:2-methylcitrate synthase/citrate synthase II|nr:citrate/2-methylcitrate synthase [Chthoniobacterales bacterium]
MTTENKPAYSPGLAGVIAGETEICWVDPNAGLMYRGYDIHEMAEQASFEEVAYLLLNSDLPTLRQLEEFKQQIAKERPLPKEVMEMLRLLPKNTHPMDMLRTGVSMLAPFDPELNDNSHDANIRKAIRLIAKVSTLITDGYRIQHGQNPLPEKSDLTLAGNLFYKLTGEVPPTWKIRMMDTIFILYADHEFNASTFAARVTAATLADMYAAVTSACGTLKGPLHGGANEESMKMLDEIGTPDRAEKWMMEALAQKKKIMGFGHRVYKKGDSRVPIMREIARDLGERVGKEQWVPICENLEATMEREKHLCANVDLYAAPVFTMLNFDPALNTPIFAASRVAGWCAHVVEQQDNNRLIRPRSLYTGPAQRPYKGLSPNGAGKA